jgi:hypothetical protein
MIVAVGCGESEAPSPRPTASEAAAPRDDADRQAPRGERPRLVPASCPGSARNCRAATGRVAFVERVDPDGDGDLHVVLLGAGSLSAPGLTVLDVSRALRPNRDPTVGDLVTGAGPVYRGSYGQRQIQVTVFRTAPDR